jgi:hypothetical protein
MKPFIILFCILMITVPGFGNQESEWKEFVSKIGGFSLLMPGTPTEIKPEELGYVDNAPVHIYGIQRGNIRYFAETMEFFTYPSLEYALNMVNSTVTRFGDPAQSGAAKKKSMMIGHYFGSEVLIDFNDSVLKTRTFLVRRTLITLITVESKAKPASGDAERFLQSFKLTAAPELKAEYKEPPKAVRRPQPKIKRTEEAARKQAIELVTPEYPDHARPRNLVDDVIVEIIIDENGVVEDATGIKGDAIFYNPAVVAARDSSFKPCLLNGKPIRVLSQLTYHFSPDK